MRSMKRVLLLLAVLLFSAGTMMAQQDKAAEKAAKKAEKEAKKAAEAAEQMGLVRTRCTSTEGERFCIGSRTCRV